MKLGFVGYGEADIWAKSEENEDYEYIDCDCNE